MAEFDKCPICNNASQVHALSDKSANSIECKLCGKYIISKSVQLKVLNDPSKKSLFYLISGYIRNQHEKGHMISLEENDVDYIFKQGPPALEEKLNLLLLFIYNRTDEFEQSIPLHSDYDYSINYCKNPKEFTRILYELEKLEFVKFVNRQEGLWAITLKGIKEAIKLFNSNTNSKICFLAMDFDNNFDPIYKNIVELIEKLGFELKYLKTHHHNNLIDDEMIGLIKRSRFLIAEITTSNSGVCFEAGYAMGLKIPVIFICQDNKKRHFDVEHYNTIFYSEQIDLIKKLKDRIQATIL